MTEKAVDPSTSRKRKRETTPALWSVQEDFSCPVCYELLYDPVKLKCGHVFCMHCLSQWTASNDKGVLSCPLDRTVLAGLPTVVHAEILETIQAKFKQQYEERAKYVEAEKAVITSGVVRQLSTRSQANARLVKNLKALEGEHVLRANTPLEYALLALPRGEFVPPLFRCQAYSVHQPLHIPSLQVDVTPTAVQVYSLLMLDVQESHSVLEVGTGCGVTTALLAQLVGTSGLVHSIDVRPSVLAFARRNLDTQRRRVTEVMQARTHAGRRDACLREGGLMQRASMHDFAPGAIFHGSYSEPPTADEDEDDSPPQQFYLLVESVDTADDTFDGKIHWTNRGKTVSFCRGRVCLGPAGVLEVTVKETQVYCTRYPWESLSWIPSEYRMTWDGEQLKGRAESKPGSAITGRAIKRDGQYLPLLDNITLAEANVFTPEEMDSLTRELPQPGGYDRVHCASSCHEDKLVHILQYVKIGGLLSVVVDGDVCLVTRKPDGYELERRRRSHAAELLTPREAEIVRTSEGREKAGARQDEGAQSVYVSKCCGKPLCHKSAVMTIEHVLGGCLKVADGKALLFKPNTSLSGLRFDTSAADEFVSIPLLAGTVAAVRCAGCALSLGVYYTREPPERTSDEYFKHAFLLCENLIELREGDATASGCVQGQQSTRQARSGNECAQCDAGQKLSCAGSEEDEAERPVEGDAVTCASEGCGNVLCTSKQILSTRYRWRLDAGGEMQSAAYVNCMVKGSTTEQQPSQRTVAQGRMVVSALRCSKCDSEVGWKYVSHVSPAQRFKLLFHEGRCGLVASKVCYSFPRFMYNGWQCVPPLPMEAPPVELIRPFFSIFTASSY